MYVCTYACMHLPATVSTDTPVCTVRAVPVWGTHGTHTGDMLVSLCTTVCACACACAVMLGRACLKAHACVRVRVGAWVRACARACVRAHPNRRPVCVCVCVRACSCACACVWCVFASKRARARVVLRVSACVCARLRSDLCARLCTRVQDTRLCAQTCARHAPVCADMRTPRAPSPVLLETRTRSHERTHARARPRSAGGHARRSSRPRNKHPTVGARAPNFGDIGDQSRINRRK
jgi:hypothetical protein